MDQTNETKFSGPSSRGWSRGPDGLTDNQRLVLGIYRRLLDVSGTTPSMGEIASALPQGTATSAYSFVQNAMRGLSRRGLATIRTTLPPRAKVVARDDSAISGVIESLTAKRDALLAEVRKIDKAITNLRSAL